MSATPRINGVLGKLMDDRHELHDSNCPRLLVEEARRVEEDLNDCRERSQLALKVLKDDVIAPLQRNLDAAKARIAELESKQASLVLVGGYLCDSCQDPDLRYLWSQTRP